MMSNYFMCCEKCFELIGKQNSRAAKLWMDFCATYLEGQPDEAVLQTVDFPELRILERLGFLVSTDQDDGIVFRINGHMNTEDGQHFFCVKDEHNE